MKGKKATGNRRGKYVVRFKDVSFRTREYEVWNRGWYCGNVEKGVEQWFAFTRHSVMIETDDGFDTRKAAADALVAYENERQAKFQKRVEDNRRKRIGRARS